MGRKRATEASKAVGTSVEDVLKTFRIKPLDSISMGSRASGKDIEPQEALLPQAEKLKEKEMKQRMTRGYVRESKSALQQDGDGSKTLRSKAKGKEAGSRPSVSVKNSAQGIDRKIEDSLAHIMDDSLNPAIISSMTREKMSKDDNLVASDDNLVESDTRDAALETGEKKTGGAEFPIFSPIEAQDRSLQDKGMSIRESHDQVAPGLNGNPVEGISICAAKKGKKKTGSLNLCGRMGDPTTVVMNQEHASVQVLEAHLRSSNPLQLMGVCQGDVEKKLLSDVVTGDEKQKIGLLEGEDAWIDFFLII